MQRDRMYLLAGFQNCPPINQQIVTTAHIMGNIAHLLIEAPKDVFKDVWDCRGFWTPRTFISEMALATHGAFTDAHTVKSSF